MAPDTFRCAVCGGVFEKGTPDDVADAEALRLWNVPDAHTRADMAIVCDDCFRAGMAQEAEGGAN
jgi:rubredoxin